MSTSVMELPDVGQLPLRQALEACDRTPFTKEIVDRYMQRTLVGYRKGGNWLTQLLSRCLRSFDTVLCFAALMAMGTIVVFAVGYSELIKPERNQYVPSMVGIGIWGICTVMGFVLFVHALRAVERMITIWGPEKQPNWVQTPPRGLRFMRDIQARLPEAKFRLWSMGVPGDPFIEVCLPDGSESYFFYGWNGNNELVEIEGELIEMPPLS